MPCTVEEYHVGQLYTLMDASRENTDGDSGIEILVNEPYKSENESGQYTHKVIYMGSKMPRIVAALLPASVKRMEEKAWNAYPKCRTERFEIIVQSIHLPDNGHSENVFNLTPEQLAMREVVKVDIGKDRVDGMKPNTDPATFKSEKTGRGPLTEGWQKTTMPVMTCYKLISIKFQVFGFQTKVESLIRDNQISILTKFHKEIFCAIDRWYGLTMEDIRRLEAEIQQELAKKMAMIEGLSETPSPIESVKSNPF